MAAIERRETADGRVRWTMRVFVGRDAATGKRRFITETFDREKDAKARARKLEGAKDGGTLALPTKETLSAYLARWLDAKAGEIRPRTIHDYRAILRRYVFEPPAVVDGETGRKAAAPPIGSYRLNRLNPEAFEALYTFMRAEMGLAPRTIQYLHSILRQALGDAVRKRALPANPTDHAKRPTRAKEGGEERETIRALSKEEAGRFLEAARGERYFALWALLLTGGLRPSEALGLQWTDVDLEAGKVFIRQTLTRTGVEGWKLAATKTPRSRREVPLPLVTVKALREWRAVQGRERLQLGAEYEDHGFVFATPFGQPLDIGNLNRRDFRRVMAAAGLGTWDGEGKGRRFRPSARMYDLRHTMATLLLLAGENPKIVSERLGHASITLTLDTYSHVLPTMQEGSAAKLEAMFG